MLVNILSSIIRVVVSIATAKVVQSVLDKGYEKVSEKEAPQKKQGIDDKSDLLKVTIWTLASNAIIGIFKLLAMQGMRKVLPEKGR